MAGASHSCDTGSNAAGLDPIIEGWIRREKNRKGKASREEGFSKHTNTRSSRSNFPTMVKVLRTHDDGWYYAEVELEHNHRLADTMGERKVWKCHKYVDSSVKEIVRHLCANNVSLTKAFGVMADLHGSYYDVSFRKRSLISMCASIAHELNQDDINKTITLFSRM